MARYVCAYKSIVNGLQYIDNRDDFSIDTSTIDDSLSGEMNKIIKSFAYSVKINDLINTFYFISQPRLSIDFKTYGLESLSYAIKSTPEESCKRINIFFDKLFIDTKSEILNNIIKDKNGYVYSYDDFDVLNVKVTNYVVDYIGSKINMYTGLKVI